MHSVLLHYMFVSFISAVFQLLTVKVCIHCLYVIIQASAWWAGTDQISQLQRLDKAGWERPVDTSDFVRSPSVGALCVCVCA